jgi:DNA-directed RNA polymerase specialized sigma24 family protein
LPGWFHRLGLSKEQAQDATQTLWLFVAENIEKIPANHLGAKDKLSRIASNLAQKTKRQEAREKVRHGAANPDELPGCIPNAEQMARASELLDAIDSLPEDLRELFIANKIEGRDCVELAALTGLNDDTIWKRVWNACAQLRHKLALRDERNEKRGVVIAPADIEIPIETRAALCAFWTIKGTMPEFGGPKDPPPPPPPWFAPAVPVVPEATRKAMSKALQATLVLLIMLTSAGVVALYFFWNPVRPGTAHAGLRVPQTPAIGQINDVVEAYPTQPPAAPSARASVRKATTKSSQALDDAALEKLDGSGLTRSGSGSE